MNRIVMKIASDIIIAEQLLKIAQQIEEFTGAEAHLYRKQMKKSIEESKTKIFEKYNKK